VQIHTPLTDIKDQLITFISEGLGIAGEAFINPYNSNVPTMRRVWENKVVNYLDRVFPTKKESGQLLHSPYRRNYYPQMEMVSPGWDANIRDAVDKVNREVEILEGILDKLEKYYQFEPVDV